MSKNVPSAVTKWLPDLGSDIIYVIHSPLLNKGLRGAVRNMTIKCRQGKVEQVSIKKTCVNTVFYLSTTSTA